MAVLAASSDSIKLSISLRPAAGSEEDPGAATYYLVISQDGDIKSEDKFVQPSFYGHRQYIELALGIKKSINTSSKSNFRNSQACAAGGPSVYFFLIPEKEDQLICRIFWWRKDLGSLERSREELFSSIVVKSSKSELLTFAEELLMESRGREQEDQSNFSWPMINDDQ